MVNQNIIDYLSEGLQEGHGIESLKHALLEAGHDPSHVDEAIASLNQTSEFHKESLGNGLDGRKSRRSRKLWFLVGAFVLVIILVGAYFVFQPSSSDSGVSSQDSQLSDGTQLQVQEVVDCGEVPISFAKESGEDGDAYFAAHPEVKESFECLSDNFNACAPSRMKYISSVVVDELFIVNRSEGGMCVLQYVHGNKGIECKYTSGQIEMTHSAAENMGKPWLDAFAAYAGMGFKIFKYSPGETIGLDLIDPSTGEMETAPCVFYPYS